MLDIPERAERKTWRSVSLALRVDPDTSDRILSKEVITLSIIYRTLQNMH